MLYQVSSLLSASLNRNLTPINTFPPNPNNLAKGTSIGLISPDQLFLTNRKQPVSNFSHLDIGRIGALVNPQSFNFVSSETVDIHLDEAVNSARNEWSQGIREAWGTSKEKNVGKYYQGTGFKADPSSGWCGFFVAYNYQKSGFKYAPSLASMEKARDFFLYRQYTDRSSKKHAELDQLKSQHQSQGSQRQFFVLAESPGRKFIQNYQKYYPHINLEQQTFDYSNLPIRPGDTVLFETGRSGGHVGMVESYNPNTGKLTTIEGNTSGTGPSGNTINQGVARKTYDLTNAQTRKRIQGFGRPADGDFR